MARIHIVGDHEPDCIRQLMDVSAHAEHTALMADGHFGYVMPVGGVAAYRNKVSVNGVGVDIACGNMAIQTDLSVEDIYQHLDDYADEIVNAISFGVGRFNDERDSPDDHPLFGSSMWDAIPKNREKLWEYARRQLGTVGGGNHYVDVFADQDGRIWVGVHFGSRGLGFKIAHGFAALAQNLDWDDRPDLSSEVLLDTTSPLGRAYWTAMKLAGEYAYAGREWVARKVVDILGGISVDEVHNHHNFAWTERHFGRDLVVVRKGATPAFAGQRGFVGGSMGDMSVILQGTARGAPELLGSTVHGAGRVMGRMAAKGKWKKGRCVRPGRVTHDDMAEAIGDLVLRGGDLDEAPQVYRNLQDVLDAQGDSIEVLHKLAPLIVCMAPPRTRDPYKD